jgi:hypothetical protein
MIIKPRPFPVPEKVFVNVPGRTKAVGIPLSDLSEDDLLDLCEQFKLDVIATAGYEVVEE